MDLVDQLLDCSLALFVVELGGDFGLCLLEGLAPAGLHRIDLHHGPAEIGVNRADDCALRRGEDRVCGLLPGNSGISLSGLVVERCHGGIGACRSGSGGECGAGLGARGDRICRSLVRHDDLAQRTRIARRVGRLVGVVIGHDFLVGSGDACDLFLADARYAQRPLLGDHVVRAMGGIILLELRVARLQAGLE